MIPDREMLRDMDSCQYPAGEMMMIDCGSWRRMRQSAGAHASFAVPGGTSPGPVFDDLCAVNLDWARVHVMLTDERWVPEDSRAVQHPPAAPAAADWTVPRAAQLLPLYAAAPTPEDALDELQEALTPDLPLSLVLLGMGADMHTAIDLSRGRPAGPGAAPNGTDSARRCARRVRPSRASPCRPKVLTRR